MDCPCTACLKLDTTKFIIKRTITDVKAWFVSNFQTELDVIQVTHMRLNSFYFQLSSVTDFYVYVAVIRKKQNNLNNVLFIQILKLA